MNDSPRPDDGALPDWHPSRRRLLAAAGLSAAAAAGASTLAACGTTPKPAGQGGGGAKKGRQGASGDTLFIAGFQWGPVANFNPLSSSSGWPAGQGGFQLIYESLMRFNMLTGKLEPGLAKSMTETADAITVTLQDNATFSDGKPVTVEDVVNTFELAKRNSGLSYSNVWGYLTSIKASGKTVVFTLNPKNKNPLMVKGAISGTWVLPKAIWDPLEKNGTLQKDINAKPVGSGPFLVDKYDQTQIVLKRNDNYWGKDFYGAMPAMTSIVHPIFKGNSDGDLALERGEVDVSQQFTPQVWQMWEKKGLPVSTWQKTAPYHLPGNIPWLQINIHKKGLDNLKVRQALAHAINYKQIAETAMSNYSVPVNASVILPVGAEAKYYDQATVDSEGWTYDKAKAISILENDLKCKKGSDGIYKLPDGTRLGPWTAITPTGWSDWEAALQIVASSAKVVGIDIQTQSPQAPVVTSRMQNGDFELACWGVSGLGVASPWSRFRDLLDDRGVPAFGKTAYYNYNRFHDPKVANLLDSISTATDETKLKDFYQQLDKIWRDNIPQIGLMYRPLEFFEYNESTWTGFPNKDNPFAPPQFSGAGNTWLYKIKHTT